jgi:hypothetical protein
MNKMHTEYVVKSGQAITANGRVLTEGEVVAPEHFTDQLLPFEVIAAELVARNLVTVKGGA